MQRKNRVCWKRQCKHSPRPACLPRCKCKSTCLLHCYDQRALQAAALLAQNFTLQATLRCRLHDREGKHKLSLPEFRDLNTFLTSTQASFRRADAPGAGKLTTAEVGQALSKEGALPCSPPQLPWRRQKDGWSMQSSVTGSGQVRVEARVCLSFGHYRCILAPDSGRLTPSCMI